MLWKIKNIGDKIFKVVCWGLAGYFLYAFHSVAGFPPTIEVKASTWLYLFIGLFLFLVPYATKIRLGNILYFEREIKNVKKEVQDFKGEVRQSLSVISTSVNTISNSNIVNVTVGSPEERAAAEKELDAVSDEDTAIEAVVIKQKLVLDDEDTTMPLARTRIQIEQLLRKILGKSISVTNISQRERDIKFMSSRRLFKEFSEDYPAYKNLEKSLDYVLKVCNAAIHGQRVSDGEAEEALDLGARIIAILSDIEQGRH